MNGNRALNYLKILHNIFQIHFILSGFYVVTLVDYDNEILEARHRRGLYLSFQTEAEEKVESLPVDRSDIDYVMM